MNYIFICAIRARGKINVCTLAGWMRQARDEVHTIFTFFFFFVSVGNECWRRRQRWDWFLKSALWAWSGERKLWNGDRRDVCGRFLTKIKSKKKKNRQQQGENLPNGAFFFPNFSHWKCTIWRKWLLLVYLSVCVCASVRVRAFVYRQSKTLSLAHTDWNVRQKNFCTI